MLLAEIAGVVVIFWKKAHGNQINPEIESHGLHPKIFNFFGQKRLDFYCKEQKSVHTQQDCPLADAGSVIV